MNPSAAPSVLSRDDRSVAFTAAAAASDGPSLPAAAALLPSRDHDVFAAPSYSHNVYFNPRLAPVSNTAYPPLPNLSRDLPHLPPQYVLPGPVEMTHPPQLMNGNSFPDLNNLIMAHPFLPVVFKKVFEVCGAVAPFENPQLSPYLEDCERKARDLATVASGQGLDRTCSKYSSADVYMAAMLNALNTLQVTMQSGGSVQNHNLESTVLFAGKTISGHSWNANGRAVAIPQNTFRQGFLQGNTLVQKLGPHIGPTRTPLTEKAKAYLDKWFSDNFMNPFPSIQEKIELSKACGMSLSSVNNWFGNKRMRIKRKMSLLPAPNDQYSVDAVNMSDKVLAPRSKWHAIVLSRMNTQAGKEIIQNATGRANLYDDIPSTGGRTIGYDDDHDIHNGIRSGEQPGSMLGFQDQRLHHSSAARGLDNFQ